jgi:hypothetical protein
MLKKKIWANFQRIVEVNTQKIFNMLSNIWVWDPGSGIRKKPIPYPGSRGQKGNGSRIRIRNTASLVATSHLRFLFAYGAVPTLPNSQKAEYKTEEYSENNASIGGPGT